MDAERSAISRDVELGRSLLGQSRGSGGSGEIAECVERLQTEWTELEGNAEVWQNQLDNALANMKIFEKGMKSFENR